MSNKEKEQQKTGWGRRLIKRDFLIDPWDINLKPEEGYQRGIESPRLTRVRGWIETHGYQPDTNIILNPDKQPVDGQHRTIIAREKEISQVKCSMYEYETLEDEWRHYIELNNNRTGLAPLDEWHAKRGTGDAMATLLYRLANDPECFLYQKLNLRGLENGKYNHTIGKALTLVCRSVAWRGQWDKKHSHRINERIIKYDYHQIKNTVDLQMKWIEKIFGEYSRTNKEPYEAGTFKALIALYWEFYEQHFLSDSRSNDTVVRRLKTFNDWRSVRLADNNTSKIICIGSYFNRQVHGNSRRLKFQNL